jgi:hypothetical protein
MVPNNLRDVINLDFAIKNPFRFNNDDRPLFAASVAPAELCLDSVGEPLLGYILLQFLKN